MTDRYAVMGHPISHSKSPAIHQQFAGQFGMDIEYTAIDVAPGTFAAEVRAFREAGGKGLNVTVPYKQEAFALADRRTTRADLAGAVNTLKLDEDGILGDNTDGVGLLRDLTLNLDQKLFERRVLVLGAGGAVRGVLGPLLDQAPQLLVIANRTVSKAEELAQHFGVIGPVQACGFDALQGAAFDVVINGTAASLGGELPPLPDGLFRENALAYDLMYGAESTAFMRWADAHGAARSHDGLGMLVEQAAESFFVWRSVKPDTAPVIRSLRATLVGRET